MYERCCLRHRNLSRQNPFLISTPVRNGKCPFVEGHMEFEKKRKIQYNDKQMELSTIKQRVIKEKK